MRRAETTEDVTSSKGGLLIAVPNDDVLLMDAVNAHLSRTVPAPMEPIMALIPDSESTTHAGRNAMKRYTVFSILSATVLITATGVCPGSQPSASWNSARVRRSSGDNAPED
jgi:hypothetical protein